MFGYTNFAQSLSGRTVIVVRKTLVSGNPSSEEVCEWGLNVTRPVLWFRVRRLLVLHRTEQLAPN
jgi:hypothetical protein